MNHQRETTRRLIHDVGAKPAGGAFASGHGGTTGLIAAKPSNLRAGSRNRWPRCGAKTRRGTPCVAAGAGLGARCGHGRCINHGGLSLGRRPGDELVFFGCANLGAALYGFGPRRREPWRVNAIPRWIAEQLPPHALCEPEYCRHLLGKLDLKRRTGRVVRGLYRSWPQVIGFRPALLLLERERVAYGSFAYSADLSRWTRSRPALEADLPAPLRVESSDLLAAMRASGGSIAKRPQRVEVDQ
jgi:hypothetical protein